MGSLFCVVFWILMSIVILGNVSRVFVFLWFIEFSKGVILFGENIGKIPFFTIAIMGDSLPTYLLYSSNFLYFFSQHIDV